LVERSGGGIGRDLEASAVFVSPLVLLSGGRGDDAANEPIGTADRKRKK